MKIQPLTNLFLGQVRVCIEDAVIIVLLLIQFPNDKTLSQHFRGWFTRHYCNE